MSLKDYAIGILFSLLVFTSIWLVYEIQPREYTEEVERDSSTTTEVDTTHPPDTVRVIETEVKEPDTTISDTLVIRERDTFRTEPNNDLSNFRRYTTEVSDSLLTGTIKTTVQGYLVSQNFNYIPEYPIVVNVNTTTRVNETVTRTLRPKGYLSFGVRTSTDFKTIRGIEVTGSWTRPNGNRISYGYDPSKKYHSIGLSINLRNLLN